MKPSALITMLIICAGPAFGGDPSTSPEAHKRLVAYEERVGGTFIHVWKAAAAVQAKNGIGEYEAYVLSSAYLYAYISSCSSIHSLKDHGDRWLAETRVGEPPGEPGPPITIEKASGATFSPKKETVVDPKVYLTFAQQI
jgi:cytochrome c1